MLKKDYSYFISNDYQITIYLYIHYLSINSNTILFNIFLRSSTFKKSDYTFRSCVLLILIFYSINYNEAYFAPIFTKNENFIYVRTSVGMLFLSRFITTYPTYNSRTLLVRSHVYVRAYACGTQRKN